MGFPAKLTDEEQALVNKYAFLKKKRRVSTNQKSSSSSSESKEVSTIPRKEVTVKEAVKPKDAKEIAKQLIASGQVKLAKDSGNRSFKRARSSVGLERKPRDVTESPSSTKAQVKKIENIRRDSYKNFVQGEKNQEPENSNEQRSPRKNFDRRSGQRNLFVKGFNLTRAILEKAFANHGPIKSTYFDQDKGVGYVDFENPDAAQKAIDDLHGSQVENCNLKVMYARRQPHHVDDNRYTTRPNRIRQDVPNRKIRRQPDYRGEHYDGGGRSSDESPTKAPPSKRKVVEYSEEDLF